MRISRYRQGFTLIELLVALGLLGALLGVLFSVESSVIQASGKQQATAARLGVITDLTGYVGDRLKTAALLPDGLLLGGAACLRSPPADTLPCLAVVTPQVSGGAVAVWELHAFRYVSPATLSAQEATPHLQGANVALKELIVTGTCGAAAPVNATLSSCFAGTPVVSLLNDELALPVGAEAFAYDAAQRLVVLNLRSVSSVRGQLTYLPAGSNSTLKIYARNVE